MAETRTSQIIRDVMKELKASLLSQIQTMFDEQNAKIERNGAALIEALRVEALRLHPAGVPEKTSSNQERQTTGTLIQKNLYSGDTSLAKLSFPHFNDEKVKEGESTALHEFDGIVDTRIRLPEDYRVSLYSSPPPPPSSLHHRHSKDSREKRDAEDFVHLQYHQGGSRQGGSDYFDRNRSSQAHPRQSGFDSWQASEGTEVILPVNKEIEFKKGQCEKNKESTVDPRKFLVFAQMIERRAQALRRVLHHRFLSRSYKLGNVTSSTTTTSSSLNDSELGFVLDVEGINDRCQKWQWRGKYSINYLVQGGIEGETRSALLLVHGFGTSNPHWRRNILTLAEHHVVYAIDLTGFGSSDKPIGFQYTMESWDEPLVDFLDEVVQKPTVLIGNSVGNLACVVAAWESSGGLVIGIVLLNCAGDMNNKVSVDDWRIKLLLPLLWPIDFLLKQRPVAWKRINELRLTEEEVGKLRFFVFQTAYSDIHWGMFTPAIKGQGPEEQKKKWLSMAYRMHITGCYAQTVLVHGSNVQDLETTATLDTETGEFVVHSPTLTSSKWWPGGLGKVSTHAYTAGLKSLTTFVSADTIEECRKDDRFFMETVVYMRRIEQLMQYRCNVQLATNWSILHVIVEVFAARAVRLSVAYVQRSKLQAKKQIFLSEFLSCCSLRTLAPLSLLLYMLTVTKL